MCGGKQSVEKVFIYATLFRLYSGIITQTARCKRRRESAPTRVSLTHAQPWGMVLTHRQGSGSE